MKVYSSTTLNENGNIEEDPVYTVSINHNFGVAYIKDDEITVVTYEEKEEEEVSKLYTSTYRLKSDTYENVGENRLLTMLPMTQYDYELIEGNKAVVCISDHEPLTVVSVETGEILYQSQIVGKVLKVDPREKSIFVSTYIALQKFPMDINVE